MSLSLSLPLFVSFPTQAIETISIATSHFFDQVDYVTTYSELEFLSSINHNAKKYFRCRFYLAISWYWKVYEGWYVSDTGVSIILCRTPTYKTYRFTAYREIKCYSHLVGDLEHSYRNMTAGLRNASSNVADSTLKYFVHK